MRSFLRRFGRFVSNMLHGFDRVRFRGSVRWLARPAGMMSFLWKLQVLLKDFPAFAKDATARLRPALEQAAKEQGRPLEYLASGDIAKEERAREIAERDGIREGLVAVFTSVEPCLTYRVHGVRATGKLALQLERGKCLHYYHYYLDRDLGLLHTRQQTWFPFTNFVWLNGREWLGRQMDRLGLKYERRANCFAWLEDAARAQALMDEQLRTNWTELLEGLARRSNPLHGQLFAMPLHYYWSVEASEWATDALFRSQQDLAKLMPALVRHGMVVLGSADVLRYLGHKLPAHGGVNGHFAGEVTTDFKRRPEGVRLKFQVDKNWIKLYDKQATVLRVETVLNDVEGMKAYRAKENDPDGPKDWRKLRKGVADLHRRAEISHKANERYAEALASVAEPTPLAELSTPVCRPVRWRGRRVRALNPLAEQDASLLQAVSRGEFLINGFRNRDIRPLLHGVAPNKREQRRQAAAVTRHLRLLRAHGLIQKVPKTHRYQLTEQGKKTISALLAARTSNIEELIKAA
jgi:hypothetical protein